jgi:hypothetical protein
MDERLLLDMGQGFVFFTPEGLEKTSKMMDALAPAPPRASAGLPAATQARTVSATKVIPPRQKQIEAQSPNPLTENITWLLELMTQNVSQLKLSPEEDKKVTAYLTSLKALIQNTPNPALAKQVCVGLSKTIEDPIKKFLESGGQPVIWGAVRALLAQL